MTLKVDQVITKKMPDRRIVVYKTGINPSMIRLAVDKIKKDLFIKRGFFGPKSEEVKYVSIDKHYEPYIFLEGKYSIDYYCKHPFTLQVDDDTEEIIIFGKKLKPKIVNDPEKGTYGVVTLEAEKHFCRQKEVNLILDKAGIEVPLKRIPLAPTEEDPKRIFEEYKDNIEEPKIPSDKGIEVLRSKIVQRPEKMARIEKELFEVSEHAVIYTPIYWLTFQNVKTGEKKIVKIDGVTANIL